MNFVKKSFNLDPDTAQRVEDFLRENPAFSFTLVMNQAISQWLTKPQFTLNAKKMSNDDVDRFMKENEELMDDLAK